MAVARVTARRKAPDPALFIGSGKADEIKAMVAATSAHGVIFDQALSPAQQRNLERHLGVPVADRTALILDIFAERAQSHEGKLQVELARLQYMATRLVRRWSPPGAPAAAASARAAARAKRRSNSTAA